MGRRPNWTESEIMHLGFLIQAGFTNPEIAKIMGKPRFGVQIKAHKVFGGNPNYLKSVTKHRHLREPVMKYFLKHSLEETRKKFGLTESEIKSIFTIGYRDPKLKHLRKETRRHDAWSAKEYLFLLRFAGLKPREWIARKLKRGGVHAVKDRLEKLGISSKNLQGITLSQFRQAFGCEPKRYVKTKAGPSGGIFNDSYFKIILWTDLDNWLSREVISAPELFVIHCRTMAIFQKWVWKNYKRLDGRWV